MVKTLSLYFALHTSGPLYVEIPLNSSSEEFKRIAAFFARTASQQILSIKRIQNKPLLFLYQRRRAAIAAKPQNGNSANEELFFHGAKQPGITGKICMSGFDERFGNGLLWFSTNANYSIGYCQDKRMILARLALGYISQDSNHCGNQSVGHRRMDDQVGGGSDNRYTLPDACQTYPAYLIQFS
ncbi:unnamed protein product [Durusdinium trenchii]|uniref:PARP catalytic domain-containing protein n=2 Tax=Durusdinium trenchii TaxID=1381693 RepID=A0ABP0SJF1_9DINO